MESGEFEKRRAAGRDRIPASQTRKPINPHTRIPDLHGQTALITGAAKRLGRATAFALADEGANILVHYRNSAEEATGLVEEIAGRGVKAYCIQADFEKQAEYESLIERSLKAAGRLDILVNNASIFPQSKLADVTFEDMVSNLQVNAWAPFVLTREFARLVGRGKVINLLDSRIGGYDRSHVAYILSKQVLAGLTRMTAIEYAPEITVNGVAPALILPPPGEDEQYLDQLTGAVPLKRHGDPEDIAEAIVYLAKSDFLTGEVIYVDGGRHLREG